MSKLKPYPFCEDGDWNEVGTKKHSVKMLLHLDRCFFKSKTFIEMWDERQVYRWNRRAESKEGADE